MIIEHRKANVIIGGQWGSEGKGKLAGWLYDRFPGITVAVSDFTPNTGHTYVDSNGKSYVSKILPIGTIFETVEHVIIGPHAVIDTNRFMEEVSAFRHSGKNAEIHVHPMASVLTARNRADEARGLGHVASTMQGSAAAATAKAMRISDLAVCRLARGEPVLKDLLVDTQMLMQQFLKEGRTALIETGQGFDLGLNTGFVWPFTTGRDVLLGRALDSAGVHPRQLGSVIGALRTYPIRVGNIEEGGSGPCHPDQEEVTWEMLSTRIGREVIERTTVTKRIRRVFSWSDIQVVKFLTLCKPDYAFLNFVNYLRSVEFEVTVDRVRDLLAEYDCNLALLGSGPALGEMEFCEVKP